MILLYTAFPLYFSGPNELKICYIWQTICKPVPYKYMYKGNTIEMNNNMV